LNDDDPRLEPIDPPDRGLRTVLDPRGTYFALFVARVAKLLPHGVFSTESLRRKLESLPRWDELGGDVEAVLELLYFRGFIARVADPRRHGEFWVRTQRLRADPSIVGGKVDLKYRTRTAYCQSPSLFLHDDFGRRDVLQQLLEQHTPTSAALRVAVAFDLTARSVRGADGRTFDTVTQAVAELELWSEEQISSHYERFGTLGIGRQNEMRAR
jgi:hypothetical protein